MNRVDGARVTWFLGVCLFCAGLCHSHLRDIANLVLLLLLLLLVYEHGGVAWLLACQFAAQPVYLAGVVVARYELVFEFGAENSCKVED